MNTQAVQEHQEQPLLPPASSEVHGTQQVRFNLSELYSGIDDDRIHQDLERLVQMYQSFDTKYRGRLSSCLGQALRDLEALSALEAKINTFFVLSQSCEIGNQNIARASSAVTERLERVTSQHFSFFEIELSNVDQEHVDFQILQDTFLSARRSYIDWIRSQKAHNLAPQVESALQRRASVGSSAISDLFDEVLGNARFSVAPVLGEANELPKQELSLEEILEVVNSHPDARMRRAALAVLNNGVRTHVGVVATAALNSVIGSHLIEIDERKYPHTMALENRSNKVDDAIVEALHVAVERVGPSYVKRYYTLLASAMNLSMPLAWSDRNISLEKGQTKIPWDEGVRIVRSAYESFSPTLARLFDEIRQRGDIDAPRLQEKESGAFCYSVVFPEPQGPRSFVFLNYNGTLDSVETLAHEVGHAVHGLLAGGAQGVLLFDPSTAFAETASTFGERITFEHLLSLACGPEERFRMLMERALGALNTVVRQISFSAFERDVHAERKRGKVTTDQLNDIWLDVSQRFYGPDGEVFSFQDMESLWGYVSHFHSPFYVYSYAFGELVTAALYGKRKELGTRFEGLYLDLLRAGGAKDALELLAPFGLDPRKTTFWEEALEQGIGRFLSEAEEVFRRIHSSP
jgi:oligoendopeptidase F